MGPSYQRSQAMSYLTSVRNAQADAGSVSVEVVPVSTGALNPGPTIAAFAKAKGAELVVVGSRGMGAVAGCERFGSVTDRFKQSSSWNARQYARRA